MKNYPAKSRSIGQDNFYYSGNYQRNEFYFKRLFTIYVYRRISVRYEWRITQASWSYMGIVQIWVLKLYWTEMQFSFGPERTNCPPLDDNFSLFLQNLTYWLLLSCLPLKNKLTLPCLILAFKELDSDLQHI